MPESRPAPGPRPTQGRRTSSGAGRVLVAVYAVLALSATGRSSVQLLTHADEAPVPYALSALAALVYIAATLGLARDGDVWRRVAWVAVLVELVGVVAIGTVSVVHADWFPDDTVWSVYGMGYGFLPLVLPFLGVAWLLRTRPRAA
ncbi:hypothetical protein RDV89_07345 [Nocardioides zeae]|uniref:Integral membrane protein n=1 Tax=Nocardioides imazamoxiresistens TaxID=3231893 RepID=A0ABU3PUH9_9ACTN|nr:hypothetical protein [Nocardioides zeae]MDT9592877.1 hypothetical protein [Nocardioides zeae]